MAEWYYTDLWKNQVGPLDGEGLLALNDCGTINYQTPVWKEGMSQWDSLSSVAVELFETTEIGTCVFSGRIMERGEMLPYGSALVDPNAKQHFVQSLMEEGRVIKDDVAEPSKYVGFWWRSLGVLLDETVKWAIMLIALVVISSIGAVVIKMIPSISVENFFDGETDNAVVGIFMAIASLVFAVVFLAANAIYEVWMVGKYQGTLGKIVLGACVVRPDDSRVSYWRSFGRWLAKCPLSLELAKLLPIIIFYMFIGFMVAGGVSGKPVMIISSVFLGVVIPIVFGVATSSVFWMAAFDSDKRALHDRICATRVVAKSALVRDKIDPEDEVSDAALVGSSSALSGE